MGKTLDVLLGRGFKPSKFKALVNLSISHLAVLKNQKQTRWYISRSDVVQLLQLGEHERALLRVEQVIKESNMLDVYAMIEGYCILLSERVKIIEHEKICPDELKETVSSLLFAASRCGEFPELQEIRRVLTTRYGKEFNRQATELRNNCGVNPKMIQKLSTRMPSLDSRMIVLNDMATENGIKLQIPSVAAEDKQNTGKEKQPEHEQNLSASWHGSYLGEDLKNYAEEMNKVEEFADSVHKRKQYKHVADAAQEAFLSAAYAAAAARAAVELSRSGPRPPDEPSVPDSQRKHVVNSNYEKDKGPHSKNDGETIKSEGPETIHVNELHQQVKYNDTKFEKKVEKFNTFSIGDQWEENGMKEPYFSNKQRPSSFQTISKSDVEVHSFPGSEVRSPPRLNIGRKLISVRTRR